MLQLWVYDFMKSWQWKRAKLENVILNCLWSGVELTRLEGTLGQSLGLPFRMAGQVSPKGSAVVLRLL